MHSEGELDENKKKYFFENYQVIMTYFSVFVLSLISGATMSWTSPMVKRLNSTDNPLERILTVDESSWVASIPILGTIVGSLMYGVLGQSYGRKSLITSIGIPFMFFYSIMPFAKRVWIYYVVRFISGISGGGILTILPMYIGELAKPNVRGRYFVLIAVSTNLGTLITYSTAPFMSFFSYHICFAIATFTFLIIFTIFALESPYYTIQKDPVRAEEVLKKLRDKNDVAEEFNRMKIGQQKSSDENWMAALKAKATRKALVMSMGLSSSFIFSGNMTVLIYTQFIFDSAGGAWSGEINTIILSVFQVSATILSSSFADRFGRKPLLAISFCVLSLSEGILSCYLILKDNGTDVSSVMKWLPILSLMAIVAAWSFASIGSSLSGELFSMNAKNAAMAICTVYVGILGFVLTFLFQRIQIAIGLGQSFLIFAGFSACSVIFIMFVLIETKGKSLFQIQDELDGIEKKNNDVRT